MSNKKPLVQKVIPASLHSYFLVEKKNNNINVDRYSSPIKLHSCISGASTQLNNMADNLSKASSVYLDEEDYCPTKLMIKVPPTDKEQTIEVIEITNAGCLNIMSMLTKDLKVDPVILKNNNNLISCVITLFLKHHLCRIGDVQCKVVYPHYFPKQGSDLSLGKTPISCGSCVGFQDSMPPISARKQGINDSIGSNKRSCSEIPIK